MIHSLRLGKLNTSLLFGATVLCCLFAWLAVSADPGTAANQSRTGGLSIPSAQPETTEPAAPAAPALATRFGNRTLRQGMAGDDVRVLKGIVRSKALLIGSPLTTDFDAPTTSAVKRFQREVEMAKSGVVNKKTAKSMVRSLPRRHASFYGPGLYGNSTACGQKLRPGTIGLAHKTLPCGSKVLIGYHGRYLITKVIDRGPYIAGRTWDLTEAAAKALNFNNGVGDVRHAVIKRK